MENNKLMISLKIFLLITFAIALFSVSTFAYGYYGGSSGVYYHQSTYMNSGSSYMSYHSSFTFYSWSCCGCCTYDCSDSSDGSDENDQNQGECTPGNTDSQSCGNCGIQTRTCNSNHYWGSWNTCTGQGQCTPGTTQTQDCGYGGTQTKTCSSTCGWNPWGTCTGQGQCSSGERETRSCGYENTGTQIRDCINWFWGEWGTCTGENTLPEVALINPEQESTETSKNVLFSYTVNDVESGIESCSLHLDGSIHSTDISIIKNNQQTFSAALEEGSHNWYISCTENSVNQFTGTSETRVFTIIIPDTSSPVINLVTPDNGAMFKPSETITFTYQVNDLIGYIQSCSLLIDGKLDQTGTSIIEGVDQSFTQTGISTGIHTWQVKCVDDSSNSGYSSTRNFKVRGDLDISSIECFPRVIEGFDQSCSVYVNSEHDNSPVAGARVNFYDAYDHSLVGSCSSTTDSITGGCTGMFKTGLPGHYSVYATAEKGEYVSDTDTFPRYDYDVLSYRYDITDLNVYNDSEFRQEDYDFLRDETIYVKFQVFDKQEVKLAQGMITKAALISAPGGRAVLDFIGENNYWYYYRLRIPPTHDFLGNSQVFTFAFNFTDESGGQKHVNLTIRNNIPQIVGPVPDIIVKKTTPLKVSLTKYEWDIEDSGKDLVWNAIRKSDTTSFKLNVDANDNMVITPLKKGSDTIKLILRDLDGDIDSQEIKITILETPRENLPVDYPRRTLQIRHIRINSVEYPEVLPGEQLYISNFFWNIGEKDVKSATFRVTCEGLGISGKRGPFKGPDIDDIMAKEVLLDIPGYAEPGVYTCRATLRTNTGLIRTRHRDIRVL